MANGIAPKFTTTNQSTYKHPHREQSDNKHYQPQLFVNLESRDRAHGKHTMQWFQDQRRSCIAEGVLKNNLSSLNSPQRPSCYSEKPDKALGARKQSRDALFPTIHNQPHYELTHRIPNRMRDRDAAFMRDAMSHRVQYRNMTGSRSTQKVARFYYPYTACETFKRRDMDRGCITDNPNVFVSAREFVCEKKREEPLVKHMETNVTL